jgi:hypothetical protein
MNRFRLPFVAATPSALRATSTRTGLPLSSLYYITCAHHATYTLPTWSVALHYTSRNQLPSESRSYIISSTTRAVHGASMSSAP